MEERIHGWTGGSLSSGASGLQVVEVPGGRASRRAAVPVPGRGRGRYLDDLTGFVWQFPLQRISVAGRQDAVEFGLGIRAGALNGTLGPAYQVLGVPVPIPAVCALLAMRRDAVCVTEARVPAASAASAVCGRPCVSGCSLSCRRASLRRSSRPGLGIRAVRVGT